MRGNFRIFFLLHVVMLASLLVLSGCGLSDEVTESNHGASQQLIGELSLVDSDSSETLMRFSLVNVSDQPGYFLSYKTPLRGFEQDILMVEHDNQPVEYIGKLAFRLEPQEKDWIRLEPGESISVEFDIAAQYDIQSPGAYSIRYSTRQPFVAADSAGNTPVFGDIDPSLYHTVESNRIAMQVTNPIQRSDVDLPLYDSGCSSSQSSTARSAQSYGRSQTAGAYYNTRDDTNFYNKWFGTSQSTVLNNLARIYNEMGKSFFYTCTTCNAIAYVYKNQADRIWLCGGFWNLDSRMKASVVLHEASHWYVTAGTDDVVYGCSNAQNLSPSSKIRNADNYRCAGYYSR